MNTLRDIVEGEQALQPLLDSPDGLLVQAFLGLHVLLEPRVVLGKKMISLPPGGPRGPQEAPGGPRRLQEAPGGTRRHQEAPGGSRRHQDAPGGTRRHQEASEKDSQSCPEHLDLLLLDGALLATARHMLIGAALCHQLLGRSSQIRFGIMAFPKRCTRRSPGQSDRKKPIFLYLELLSGRKIPMFSALALRKHEPEMIHIKIQ